MLERVVPLSLHDRPRHRHRRQLAGKCKRTHRRQLAGKCKRPDTYNKPSLALTLKPDLTLWPLLNY